MTKLPFFSVVIPSFNYGRLLPRAIDSVLQQEKELFELIVINDGSIDNTAQLMQEISVRHPEIIYHEQQNAGPAAARNQGATMSKGEWLCFLDADDELAPDALKLIARELSSSAADYLLAGYITVSEAGKTKEHSPKALSTSPATNFKRYLAGEFSLANGAIFFRRSLFERYQYPVHLKQAEDVPLLSHVIASHQGATTNQPAAIIHKHSGSRRNDLEKARQAGLSLVDAVFDSERLPAELQSLKPWFKRQKQLSLFRRFYKAGEHRTALTYYAGVLKSAPLQALRWNYLSKAIRAWFKSRA